MIGVEELGTILGVWAHPDDETYLMGAIMALARDAGQRVLCLSATRGEAGSQDQERWPSATLGEVRERELTAALAILGVAEHRFLGYPDGGCDAADADEASATIAAAIDEVQPDTVLTFGPDGMTFHTDHIAVHHWTTAAFKEAAKPGARLAYATHTPEFMALTLPLLEGLGVFYGAPPPATPRTELSCLVEAVGDLALRKRRALLAQESQTAGLFAAIADEDLILRVLAEEAFRPA